MTNLKINNILKTLFSVFLIFVLTFIWFNFYVKNFWLNLIISLFITIFVQILIFLISKLKNKHKHQYLDISAYLNTLTINGQSYCVNFFYEMLQKHFEVIKKNKYLKINSTIIYPYFVFRKFCFDDVLSIINLLPQKTNLIILTNNIDDTVFDYIKNFELKIKILNSEMVCKLFFEKFNYFPPKTEIIKKRKTFKEMLSFAFNKKRTKSYFFISLLLLFYSFFTPFKLYYIIMSSLLLILSYISFCNVKYNNTKPETLNF